MDLGNVFPRNPDGSLKRKKPCQTTGCQHPNWHICLDTAEPEHTRVRFLANKRPMSPEQRLAISEAQRDRHALIRELTAPRDNKIIKYYTEDNLGMSSIAQRMDIAQSTVNKVLKRAQREGVLKIRPKNFTLSRPGSR